MPYGTAAIAARLLLATPLIWMLLFRLSSFIRAPLFEACWSVFPLAVMLSGTVVLYVWFATAWDREYLRSTSSISSLSIAAVLVKFSYV
jgi:hypothetical protein